MFGAWAAGGAQESLDLRGLPLCDLLLGGTCTNGLRPRGHGHTGCGEDRVRILRGMNYQESMTPPAAPLRGDHAPGMVEGLSKSLPRGLGT